MMAVKRCHICRTAQILLQCQKRVRSLIGPVAAGLGSVVDLMLALAEMTRMVAAAGEVRRRRPATFQTMLDPDHDGLSIDTTARECSSFG